GVRAGFSRPTDRLKPFHTLRVLLATIVVVASVLACRRHSAISIQPSRDIILITIDTTRADALGYSGNKRVKTPFLDSLAGQGLVFMNAHAHTVVTLPSH